VSLAGFRVDCSCRGLWRDLFNKRNFSLASEKRGLLNVCRMARHDVPDSGRHPMWKVAK
jgi:hypothetical protein